jgi:hypothetical protein
MADTNTLAGLLLLNDARMADVYPTDVLNDAPVVSRIFAMAASQGGTAHKYLRTLTAPGVGFRDISNGIVNAAGSFEEVDVTCKLLDATFTRDKALAIGYRKGAQAYMDKEGLASLRAAFFALEQAIFTSSVNKQFIGLPGNTFYDAITVDSQVVNAGGSGGKSVWLLRDADDGVALIAGNDGRVDMAAEDATVQVVQGNGTYTGLMRSLMGWFGLQTGSKYDAARICNLDGTSGKTLTDVLIAQAIAKFPAARQPKMICMSRTSLYELQASRTAVNPTGAPAPFPVEAFGVPIVVTDAIPENESAINTTTTTTTTSTTA